MSWHRAIPSACVALVLIFLPGCDRAWQAYEQMELGRPIPERNLLRREGNSSDSGRCWGHAAIVNFPAIVASLEVSAVEDNEGRVGAKLYRAVALGHWVLCQTAAFRTEMEVQIPEHAFHDPREGWQPPEADLSELVRASGWLEQLADEFPISQRPSIIWESGQRTSAGRGARVHSIAYPIQPRRVKQYVLDRLEAGVDRVSVDLSQDVLLTGLEHADEIRNSGLEAAILWNDECSCHYLEITVRTPYEPVSNVLEYLLLLKQLPGLSGVGALEPKGLDRSTACLFFGLSMYSYPRAPALNDVVEIPGAFSGVTRDGYELIYREPSGGVLRIQNVGNRRIRMQSKYFVMLDPFMISAVLECAITKRDIASTRERLLVRQGRP